jgi:hypothetical protein
VHLVCGEPELGGEPLPHGQGGCVRVTVERGLGVDRLDHPGQRFERILVTGELEGICGGWLPLLVGREGNDLGAQAD